MLTIHTDLGDIDYSYELYLEERIGGMPLTASGVVNCIKAAIFRTKLESSQIDAMDYIESQGYTRPESVRILDAHGDSEYYPEKFYVYQDFNEDGSRIYRSIRDWVNEHDGQYDVLFIKPCNPIGINVHARYSFIIYPIGIYYDGRIRNNDVALSVPVSARGCIRRNNRINNKYQANNFSHYL